MHQSTREQGNNKQNNGNTVSHCSKVFQKLLEIKAIHVINHGGKGVYSKLISSKFASALVFPNIF